MRKVQFGGKECEGEVVDFEVLDHGKPTILKAPDGTIIKVAQFISELVRVVDQNQDNGEPAYLISFAQTQSTVGVQKADLVKKVAVQ